MNDILKLFACGCIVLLLAIVAFVMIPGFMCVALSVAVGIVKHLWWLIIPGAIIYMLTH